MSYYHIKNIKFDRKNNTISADLADSSLEPLSYNHIDDLYKGETFEEKYEKFISDIIIGGFQPLESNALSTLVSNPLPSNYYDDMHDIGIPKTYQKYKGVIDSILSGNEKECTPLKSDRELNPEKYYVLHEIYIKKANEEIKSYYENERGNLYCLKNGELKECTTSEDDYGYPVYTPLDLDKFIEYNEFLKEDYKEYMEL